jgi:transposase-like protein
VSFVSKLSPDQWAEARRLRGAGQSLAAIARRFGLKPNTVRRRARQEGWSSPAGGPSDGRKTTARQPSPATAEVRAELAELARRLFGVIAVRTRMMELSMQKKLQARENNEAGADQPLTTKDEREAFAALIADIKQVMEITPEPAAAADGRRTSADPELTALSSDIDPDALAAASEKAALGAELAERLGRMFPQP